MAAGSVDLTALLPALKEAAKPFEEAKAQADRLRISPGTAVRNYAPLCTLPIGTVWRLLETVQAIRRVAGDVQ